MQLVMAEFHFAFFSLFIVLAVFVLAESDSVTQFVMKMTKIPPPLFEPAIPISTT